METINKLREELKAKGWNSRRVSVKDGGGQYDTCIKVNVKDVTIPIREVEAVVKKHEEIDRCKVSGEILCGGNTFVLVSYDWDAEQAAIQQRMPKAQAAMEAVKELAPGDSKSILEVNGMKLWYMRDREGGRDRVALFDVAGNSQGGIELHSIEYLAKAIMKVELYGTLR